jgi:cell division protein FtsQ
MTDDRPSSVAAGPAEKPKSRLLTRGLKLALFGIAALLVVSSPLWAPLLMRRMAFFRVRRIEIVGARYVAPGDILARLHVDTTVSVWDPTATLVARVAKHPEVETVVIHRKLPGTLVVTITERAPVALVPSANGFRVYDARGVALPIDPTRVTVDAPVLMRPDVGVLRLLGAMRMRAPSLYSRVSSIQRVGAAQDELLLELKDVPVRAMQDVTLERLADIDPVAADLNRKQLRVAEIDLRFRDQVIARLQ